MNKQMQNFIRQHTSFVFIKLSSVALDNVLTATADKFSDGTYDSWHYFYRRAANMVDGLVRK